MADTVNFLLTLFIATFTVTGILWLALVLSGQAHMNTVPRADNEETPIK